MTNKAEAFGGFNGLVDMLMRTEDGPKDVTKTDDEPTVKLSKSVESKDIEDVDDDEERHQVKDTLTDEEKVDEVDEEEEDDTTDEDKGETTDLGEVEPEVSEFFAKNLVDKLGIELHKDAKFEKLDDVVDLMSQVIEANSVPTYASDEVEEYDKYVRNGGNLKSFYDQVYSGSVDPDKVDLEEEKDQKLVIETNLRNLGYKEDRIKNTIKRYEDAEVLKDEAEDALESIKEFTDKKAKTLLANQEKEKLESDKRNKVFVDNVISYVNNLKDIQGVEVDSKTKREIVDYIFRVTPDGTTQFQKAYAADTVKNLVGSAYFMKYGDSLLSKTSKKATDAALNKVRDKLKASKGKRNTGSGNGQGLGKVSPNFSTLSSLIIK
jgi:hypothetical protein